MANSTVQHIGHYAVTVSPDARDFIKKLEAQINGKGQADKIGKQISKDIAKGIGTANLGRALSGAMNFGGIIADGAKAGAGIASAITSQLSKIKIPAQIGVNLAKNLTGNASKAFGVLSSSALSSFNIVGGSAVSTGKTISSSVQKASSAYVKTIASMAKTSISLLRKIASSGVSTVARATVGLVKTTGSSISAMTKMYTSFGRAGVKAGKILANGIISASTTSAKSIASAMSSSSKAVASMVKSSSSAIFSFSKTVGREFASLSLSITKSIGKIPSIAARAANSTIKAINSISRAALSVASPITRGILLPFEAAARGVSKAANTVVSSVKSITLAATAATSAIAGIGVKGGWERLSTLESSKILLETVGSDAESVMNIVQKVAQGTKFSLSDVAKSAASLSAGVGLEGEKLEKVLSRISDLSTLSGGSFDDIAYIFQQVIAQGRMYSNDVLQLTSRGIPILAKLSKVLGKSTEEVSEMVSKGEIGIEDLLKATDDFSGIAQSLGSKTTIGAWENLKTAINRAGAVFLESSFTMMPELFTSIRKNVDNLAPVFKDLGDKYLKPLVEKILKFSKDMEKITENLTGLEDFLKKFSESKHGQKIAKIFDRLRPSVGFLVRLGKELKKEFFETIESSEEPIKRLLRALKLISEDEIFDGLSLEDKLFAGIDKISEIVPKIITGLAVVAENWENIKKFVSETITTAKNVINFFKNDFKPLIINTFNDIIDEVEESIRRVENMLHSKFIAPVKQAFAKVRGFITPIAKQIGEVFEPFIEPAKRILNVIKQEFPGTVRGILPNMKKITTALSPFLDDIATLAEDLIPKLSGQMSIATSSFENFMREGYPAIRELAISLAPALKTIYGVVSTITTNSGKIVGSLARGLKGTVKELNPLVDVLGKEAKNGILSLPDAIEKAFVVINPLVGSVAKTVENLIPDFKLASREAVNFAKEVAEAITRNQPSFENAGRSIISVYREAFSTAGRIVENHGDEIIRFVSDIIVRIGSIAKEVLKAIETLIDGGAGRAVKTLGDGAKYALDVVAGMIQPITDNLNVIGDSADRIFRVALKPAIDFVSDAIELLVQKITDASGVLAEMVEAFMASPAANIGNSFLAVVSKLIDDILRNIKDLTPNLINFVTEVDKNSGNISDFATNIVNIAGSAIGDVLDLGARALQRWGGELPGVSQKAEELYGGFSDNIPRIFDMLADLLDKLVDWISLVDIPGKIGTIFNGVSGNWSKALEILDKVARNILVPAIDFIFDKVSFLADSGFGLLYNNIDGVIGVFQNFGRGIEELINGDFGTFVLDVAKLATSILSLSNIQAGTNFLVDLLNGAGALGSSVLPTVVDKVSLLIDKFTQPEVANMLTTLVNTATTLISTLFSDENINLFGQVLENIAKSVTNLAEPFEQFVGGVGTLVGNIALLASEKLVEFTDFIARIVDANPEAIGDAFQWVSEKITDLVNGVTDFIARPEVQEFFKVLWETLAQIFERIDLPGIFTKLADALGDFLEKLTPLLPGLGEFVTTLGGDVMKIAVPLIEGLVKIFLKLAEWAGENPELFSKIAIGLGSIAAVGGALSLVSNAIGAIMPAVKLLGGGFKTIASIGEKIGGSKKFADIGQKAMKLFGTFSMGAVKSLGGLLAAIPVWGWIAAAIVLVVGGLIYFFTQTEKGKEVWSSFVDYIKSKTELFKEGLKVIFDFVGEKLDWIGDKIDFFKQVISTMVEIVKADFENMKNGIKAAFDFIGGILDGGKQKFDKFKENVSKALENIKSGAKEKMESFGKYINSGADAAKNMHKNFKEWIGKIPDIFRSLPDKISNAFQGIKNKVKELVSDVAALFRGIWPKIKNSFPQFIRDALGKLPGFNSGGYVEVQGFNSGGPVGANLSNVSRVASKVDTIPAMLARGEYVMQARSVNKNTIGAIEHINKYGQVPHSGEISTGNVIFNRDVIVRDDRDLEEIRMEVRRIGAEVVNTRRAMSGQMMMIRERGGRY